MNFNQPPSGIDSKKDREWREKIFELDSVIDRVGSHIDDGIRDTVAAFQLLGYLTEQSCEGHADRGRPTPWVRFSAEGKPEYRYEGEMDLLLAVMMEFRIKPEEIEKTSPLYDDEKYWRVRVEANRRISSEHFKESSEYVEWVGRNIKLLEDLAVLITEFYSYQEIEAKYPHIALSYVGSYQPVVLVIDDMVQRDEHSLGSAVEEGQSSLIRNRLQTRQDEMRRFTLFLKQKM